MPSAQTAESPICKTEPKPHFRILELDVFRGLAALAVVFHHYTHGFDKFYGHPGGAPFNFPMGFYGPHFFFIISGFVIFMTLQKTERPMDFVVSRFSRLYPAYWAALLITFCVVTFVGLPEKAVSAKVAAINLTMLQSWIEVPHVDGVYWTLALELSFYAIMFFLFCIRRLEQIEIFCVIWLGIQCVSVALENQLHWRLNLLLQNLMLAQYAHLFVAGVMFYRIRSKGHTAFRHGIIGLCLVVAFFVGGWKLAALAAGFFGAFYLFIFDRASLVVCRPLVFLGAIS
jgi:peptidoglycan/LPS O-acetylase OafA/YrhL